jgi:integrase
VEFYGSSKKEAAEKARQGVEQWKNGITENKSFRDVADYFVYQVFMNNDKYADRTKSKYIDKYNNIIRVSAIAGKKIRGISSQDWQDLYNASTSSYSTLRATNNILRLIYAYIEIERVGDDITHNLVVPKNETNYKPQSAENEIIIWDTDELLKITNNLNKQRYRFLVMIAIYTGCRIGEILALKYSDISIKKQEIYITKQVILKPIFQNNKKVGTELTITNRLKTIQSKRKISLHNVLIEEYKIHKMWHEAEMKKK